MPQVHVTGRLICATEADAQSVRAHLPDHIRLSRGEPGCLAFDVAATDDPLVWTVDETYADRAAFAAHKARTEASPWFCATAGLTRRIEARDVWVLALLLTLGQADAAPLPALSCTGDLPRWSLNLDGAVARFDQGGGGIDMTIPQRSTAEGRDDPVALTLTGGGGETAIVLIHRRACNSLPFEAQVLTQRGTTPVLLTGCCDEDRP